MSRDFCAKLALVAVVALLSVSSASAGFVDSFDRADATTLGPDWTTSAMWPTAIGISSNTASLGGADNASAYYSAYQMIGADHVIASVDFRASYASANNGRPNLWFGLNYNGTDTVPYSGPGMMVQGVVGCTFAVDGDWRDQTSTIALTPGEWYKLTLEQNGADFTGTLSTLGGATVIQHTYTSLVQTSANGYAYIGQATLFGDVVDVSSPAFDNFSLTVVPEPGTLAIIATGLLGLLAYAWRKRK
jgi:hypothetical protein